MVAAVRGGDPREQSQSDSGGEGEKQQGPLDNISLVGKQHEEGESSTEAMGRIVYRWFTGKKPRSKETRLVLSYIMHWLFSMTAAGIYGALRGPAKIPDLGGGLALGVGLWALGDEMMVPLLGLGDGPTAYPMEVHSYGLGAHIAYGLTTAATAQVLDKLL